MPPQVDPRRQHLARELLRLRTQTGLSGHQFGIRINASQSKVSKSERGLTLPAPETVRAWAVEAGADDDAVEQLVALAVECSRDLKSWAAEQGTFTTRNRAIGDVERSVTRLHNFQPSAVSGLLQTADYARRVITLLDPDGSRDVASAVAARMDRQTVLYDQDKEFVFLLAEGALRWRPGPPTLMLAQLDRLISLATLPNVTVGVLPFDQSADNLFLNGFTIFEHPDDPFVLVETYTNEEHIRDQASVDAYRQVFTRLRESAEVGAAAVAVLRRVMADLVPG